MSSRWGYRAGSEPRSDEQTKWQPLEDSVSYFKRLNYCGCTGSTRLHVRFLRNGREVRECSKCKRICVVGSE